MSTVSFTPLVDGATATAASVNTPLSTLYNDYNGNITDANIAAAAAIAFSKVSGGSSTALAAWQTWTPTWTGITPGNGVNTQALYVQIGKMVYVRGVFTGGTTSSGTGVTPILSLPVTSSASYTTGSPLGNFKYGASSLVSGYARWASTTTVSLVTYAVSGANIVDANLPIAFANTYTLAFNFFYEAA